MEIFLRVSATEKTCSKNGEKNRPPFFQSQLSKKKSLIFSVASGHLGYSFGSFPLSSGTPSFPRIGFANRP